MPRIRVQPDDFRVEEIPRYEPAGHGPHLWVRVEKRSLDTEEVATILAAAAGVPAADVGWAGRKDRHAVARQWLSVPCRDDRWLAQLDAPGLAVLAAARHEHRLRLGDLEGNRFVVRVREAGPALLQQAAGRLDEVLRRGLPNRFGRQRFGREGANPERARSLLAGASVGIGRREARLLLSALQSEVFNATLARRPVPVDAAMPGDVIVDHRYGGLRWIADPAELADELARFAASATGPMPGPKMRRPRGEVARIEREVLAALDLEGIESSPVWRRYALPGERRSVRVRVEEATLSGAGADVVVTTRLPPGSYVTVLLEELFGEIEEGPEAAH